MSLTVPYAGLTAGRAADVPTVPVSDAGANMADFGSVMKQVGDRLVAEDASRDMAKGRQKMMQGMADLRLQMDQIGDPDAIDGAYKAGKDALRQSIIGGMMPRNRADAATLFEDIAYSHGAAIGARALDLRQGQKRVILDDTARTVVNAAATADPQTRAANQAQFDTAVDERVADGTLTPEQAADLKRKAATDGDQGALATTMNSDPEAVLTGLDDGTLGANLDPVARERWRANALAEKGSRAAAAAQEAKRAQAEGLAAGKDLLSDGIKVLRGGSGFAGDAQIEAIRADPVLSQALKPELDEYDATLGLYHYKPEFAKLSLAEKKAQRAEYAAAPKAKDYQQNLVTAMDQAIAANEQAVKDGTVLDYVAQIGLKPVAPLPDPATTSDQDLLVAMATRRLAVAGLEATGITGTDRNGDPLPVPYFTPEERADWGALIAPTASPRDKARLAYTLANTKDINIGRAAAELGGDGVFTQMGGLLKQGGPPRIAQETFEGQRLVENKQGNVPSATARRVPFYTEFMSMFKDGTGQDGQDQTAIKNAIVAAADARNAFLMQGNTDLKDGEMDSATYKQALHDVMGGTGVPDTPSARGGVQSLKSPDGTYPVFLPRWVNADQVTSAIDVLIPFGQDAAMPSVAAGDGSFQGTDITPMAATAPYRVPPTKEGWLAISADDTVPDISGKLPSAYTVTNLRIRAVGPTTYEMYVVRERDGQEQVLTTSTGANWRFDMKKLLKLQAGAP
jgi:hypothetical protein